MLIELFKGMALTGRHLFARKITVQFPEEKTPQSARASAACTRCAAIRTAKSAASPASCARRSARRWPSPSRSDQRDDGTRRTTRYDIDLTKCIFCGFCEEACPVDAIVETRILEYHGEKRGDLYYTKPMLLAVGDRYEEQIAARPGGRRRAIAEEQERMFETAIFYVFAAVLLCRGVARDHRAQPGARRRCSWCSRSSPPPASGCCCAPSSSPSRWCWSTSAR